MVQEKNLKKKIYVITGPTAVGKSNFAVDCAMRFNGEIISADSMQIYKNLNVGTAKITTEEMKGIPHYLINHVSPNESYSVGKYLCDAKLCIDKILSKNKLPIIVGGTGLYINALLNGMNLSGDSENLEIREKWKNILSQRGKEYVYEYLLKIDSISASKISPNDTKRVIRAIEIFESTGTPKSQIVTTSECEYDYRFTIISDDRELLYERINARVDKMFECGLLDEVKSLIEYADNQSMQAIGYKQLVEFIRGKYQNLDETREKIKQLSRNYAKRQLTFFKGMNATNKNWITPCDFAHEIEQISNFLGNDYGN